MTERETDLPVVSLDGPDREVRLLVEQRDDLVAERTRQEQRLPGCGLLTAAKIVGEAGGISRFRSKEAFARHNGSAPVPVCSGNAVRHRLKRGGNRQLDAALYRIAVTQLRLAGPVRRISTTEWPRAIPGPSPSATPAAGSATRSFGASKPMKPPGPPACRLRLDVRETG
jgi:hypothetical protein